MIKKENHFYGEASKIDLENKIKEIFFNTYPSSYDLVAVKYFFDCPVLCFQERSTKTILFVTLKQNQKEIHVV